MAGFQSRAQRGELTNWINALFYQDAYPCRRYGHLGMYAFGPNDAEGLTRCHHTKTMWVHA